MKYRVTHTTEYAYEHPVTLCYNEARLTPRQLPHQRCHGTRVTIDPEPGDYAERNDYYRNRVCFFSIQQSHQRLEITAVTDVEVDSPASQSVLPSPDWEVVRARLRRPRLEHELFASEFLFDSPLIQTTSDLYKYAKSSFASGRPLFEAVDNLMRRIHTDFSYDPGFSSVATPLSEVMKHRRGVCQDFAQLAIGCLRSLGIPARYVSGYLETLPPPGKPRLVGADASHAWFAVYCPESGWVDFDPTNNQRPGERYITTAWGRDFSDVTPVKGVVFGSANHTLEVSVDVKPLV